MTTKKGRVPTLQTLKLLYPKTKHYFSTQAGLIRHQHNEQCNICTPDITVIQECIKNIQQIYPPSRPFKALYSFHGRHSHMQTHIQKTPLKLILYVQETRKLNAF